MSDTNVVTSCTFNDNEYLIKMITYDDTLEIAVTDKNSAEEWECSYDKIYVENLTQKTGNYKKYSVFVSMLKSGLLKTSDAVTLDLLSYEDLESLRIKKFRGRVKSMEHSVNNRRYLILTYNVEFDRIHYPLPLEYTGPPDPQILQSTIKKLRAEIQKMRDGTRSSKTTGQLQKKVEDLKHENQRLQKEIRSLRNGKESQNAQVLQKAIVNLERSVIVERNSHHQLVEKLRSEKMSLIQQVNALKRSEKSLRTTLSQVTSKSPEKRKNPPNKSYTRNKNEDVKMLFRRNPPFVTASSLQMDTRNKRSHSCPTQRSDAGLTKSVRGSSKSSSRKSSACHSRCSSASSNRSYASKDRSSCSIHQANFHDLEEKIQNLLNIIQSSAYEH